jgi:hypothetical protein
MDKIEAEEYGRLSVFPHLGAEDLSLVVSACELWGLLRKAMKAAKTSPIDTDCRQAVASYQSQYRSTLIALGIPPRERTKLDLMRKTEKPAIPTRNRA